MAKWETTLVCTKDEYLEAKQEYLEAKQTRPKWQRKDHQMVADVLAGLAEWERDLTIEVDDDGNSARSMEAYLFTLQVAYDRFVEVFSNDNERFNKAWFQKACNIEDTSHSLNADGSTMYFK